MMTAVKRALRYTAPALAAALALSGCSGATMQEGVIVNGEAYSVKEVEDATRQFSQLNGQKIAPQAVVSVAGAVPVLDEYFEGSTYRPSEQTLRNNLAQSGLEGEATGLTLDVARYQYYASILNNPASQQDPALSPILERIPDYQADLAEQTVEVNPRFGSWDPASGQVVPQVSSWITESGTS